MKNCEHDDFTASLMDFIDDDIGVFDQLVGVRIKPGTSHIGKLWSQQIVDLIENPPD
jgi:hypothetical protein